MQWIKIIFWLKKPQSSMKLLHNPKLHKAREGTAANRNLYNVYKVTFPWGLHSDVHVTQMALAALDNMGRWGWHGTGGFALLVVPQAALLLDGCPINHLQSGETVLACAAMAMLAHTALAYTLLVSEDWSASRQLYIW